MILGMIMIMKVVRINKVVDRDGKVQFEFPSDTLLDKITDEWTLIMEYYNDYYPFSLDPYIDGYRYLRYDEFHKFSKLFAVAYQSKRIRYPPKSRLTDGKYLSVGNHQLYINREGARITLNKYRQKLMYYNFDIEYNINQLCIMKSNTVVSNCLPLLILD